MPLNSLAASQAGSATQEETARELRQLSGLVYEYGKCVDAVIIPGDDPWFPAESTAYQARADEACAGCPVIEECLEMTLQLEDGLARSYIAGIFGGKTPGQRIAMIQARRGGEAS